MIRTIIICVVFALIIGLAWGAAVIADLPGNLIIESSDWQLQTPIGVMAAIIAGLVFVSMIGALLIWGLINTPKRIKRRRERRRREKGMAAVTRGLVAIAAGDSTGARLYAGDVKRLVEDEPLSQLLGAQAAQLDGDEDAAETYYTAMLDNPETEFLGLRGLLMQAQKRGDQAAALDYAKRAFSSRPRASWTFPSLFAILAEQGDWDGAIAVLDKAVKANVVEAEPARRQRAALLTAKAATLPPPDTSKGQSALDGLAIKAHKLMPGLTPAAVLAARRLYAEGKVWKASGIIEEAWRVAPHPALIEAYVALKPHESRRERVKRLKGLAEMAPTHLESCLLLARQSINSRNWAEARSKLAPLIETTPTPRVCALMAEIEQGEDNVGAAREWLARAVSAPPEPDWLRSHFEIAEFDAKDWNKLVQELGRADMVWPPAPDPALFAKDQLTVAPFTESLQDGDDWPDGKEGASGERKSVVIVERPAAVDYASDDDRDVDPLLSRRAAKGGRKVQPKEPNLRSMSGSKGLKSVNKAGVDLKSRTEERNRPNSDSGDEPRIKLYEVPRQPDDPGTEERARKAKAGASVW